MHEFKLYTGVKIRGINSVTIIYFLGSQGHGMVIQFDSERNVPTCYKIYQFKRIADKYGYKEIGEWSLNNVSR